MNMKIQTMSVVVGTNACNAKCPFCIAHQTSSAELPQVRPESINWRNFKKACTLAEVGQCTTIMLTGKGEPTLYPDLVTAYLEQIRQFKIPFVEMQTNGMVLMNEKYHQYLRDWYDLGLNTICLSAVSPHHVKNKEIYGDKYLNLYDLVPHLINYGFTIRLSIMMLKNFVDSPEEIDYLVKFCKSLGIKQLTVRPIVATDGSSDEANWTTGHTLSDRANKQINSHVKHNATALRTLEHGGVVYDYNGQNICLYNCLTTNKDPEHMRQIIFYPDGTITDDWQYAGSTIL
jgi:molybdenum cofactor biosynthesis enzyme MoaA